MVIIIATATSGGGGDYNSPPSKSPSTHSHVEPFHGTDEHPAKDDIGKIVITNEGYGFYSAKTTVTNHSSKTSDYTFQVAYTNKAGTRFAEDVGFASNVEPGETVKVTLVGTSGDDVPTGSIVTSVDRTQSY